MGSLRRLQGRLIDARIELEIAVALAPNSPVAYNQLGATLVFLGQPDAAMPHIEKSLRLAPHDRTTPVNHSYLGLCHMMLGQPEEAVVWLRKGRAGNPRLYYIHMLLAAALALKGELDEAAAALRQAIEIQPQIGSFSGIRARYKNRAAPQFLALCENTVNVGLRLAGLPS
jgi:Flp pilus assembly protein TadD